MLRLRGLETMKVSSPNRCGQLSRLLLDKIVENLSRNGREAEHKAGGLQKLIPVCAPLSTEPSPTTIRSLSIWRLFSSGPSLFTEQTYGLTTSWPGDWVNSLNSLVPLVDREMNLR